MGELVVERSFGTGFYGLTGLMNGGGLLGGRGLRQRLEIAKAFSEDFRGSSYQEME